MSEEHMLVSPQGWSGDGGRVDSSNQFLLSSKSNWLIKSIHIHEVDVWHEQGHLLGKVSLESIWECLSHSWLESQHEWPDWDVNWATKLIEFGELHNGGVTEMSSSLSELG